MRERISRLDRLHVKYALRKSGQSPPVGFPSLSSCIFRQVLISPPAFTQSDLFIQSNSDWAISLQDFPISIVLIYV